MNAQEALNEIVKLFDQMDLPEDYTKFIELKDGFASLQQLVKQSNAKPKTLEELGWEQVNHYFTTTSSEHLLIYSTDAYDEDSEENFDRTLHISKSNVIVFRDDEDGTACEDTLSYEEILAIAEKMKELGMTNE